MRDTISEMHEIIREPHKEKSIVRKQIEVMKKLLTKLEKIC